MRKAFPFAAVAFMFCLTGAGAQEQASVTAGWPQWRGPNRDGISPASPRPPQRRQTFQPLSPPR